MASLSHNWMSINELEAQVLSLTATLAIFVAVCWILRARGPRVCASACLFVLTLVSTQLIMSRLSHPPYNYKKPGFVTALHFLCVWLTCIAYWYYQGDLGKCFPSSMQSRRRFLVTVGPIALSNPLAVVFNNNALVHAGAGLCAIIGTLSPVTVAMMARLFGRQQSVTSWMGVMTAFLGGAIIASSEVRSLRKGALHSGDAAMLGICFALASVAARSLKIVVMDNLLAPTEYQESSKEETLSPMHLYTLQAPWCFVTAAFYALATEDIGEAMHDMLSSRANIAPIVGMTCISAVILNFAGIFALRDLGASSQQIIGKLNTICVASLSMGFLGEVLAWPVLLGGLIVLLGVAIFEYGVEHRSKPIITDKRCAV